MKIIENIFVGGLVFTGIICEAGAVECPPVSEALRNTKCIGDGFNYRCSYKSKFWQGEYTSPKDITKQSSVITALGRYQNLNTCRYNVQTSGNQLVSYELTYKGHE